MFPELLETDFLWMTLVVFLPTAFALGLLCFPGSAKEAMRWWALFGTAATLGVSLCLFINFKNDTLDFNGVQADREFRKNASLDERARLADFASVGSPARSKDWVTRHPWVERFHIDYYLGVDGLSMALLLLTTLLFFVSMIASWTIDRFVRGYLILFLILETGVLGSFLALDFFLFYVFWEVMLLPMYFLIGIWGGPRREYAAIKFFLYTLLGSVFILIALIAFYFTNVRDFVNPEVVAEAVKRIQVENPGLDADEVQARVVVNTFDLVVLQRVGGASLAVLNGREPTSDGLEAARKSLAAAMHDGAAPAVKAAAARRVAEAEERLRQPFFTPAFQYTVFLLLFVGFAIKVPVFPFHTWLPDAHVEAPTPVSMILAGVLLKLGGYGILRIAYPICPWAAQQLALPLALFGVINIVYGALAALAQTDFKKLVAYSSVSHMGYVILGIAVWSVAGRQQYWAFGLNGALFQMVAHGITAAGLFFVVGVIYDRAHHRNLDNFRGLFEPMPLCGGMSVLIFFAAMGLPGLCGFVGEFMVVLAAWSFAPGGNAVVGPVLAILAALTVVLTAGYMLWTVQRVFLGVNAASKNYPDMTLRESTCLLPLAAAAVALGVWPPLLLSWTEPSMTHLIDLLAAK